MNKKLLHKFTALLLAVTFAGCAWATGTPAQEPEAVSSTAALVDSRGYEPYPFAMEFPGAFDEPVLTPLSVAASVPAAAVKKVPDEVKSIWISFLEMQRLLTGKTGSEFRQNMRTVFDNVKDFGFNTVVVQVRPYADAFYRSDYFPWSHIITGVEGQHPGFDPFQIMVDEAKLRGLRVEAWVNPYRIRSSNNSKALSGDNTAKKWLDAGDESVVSLNGTISFNPASTKAQSLIVNGIVELIRNYDIEAVHIDDYFYPTTDKAFDASSYNKYTANGGAMKLDDWRRANVETLIKKIYRAVKETDPDVMFGISPQSSVYNNYYAHYLDVKKIAANEGYCDYICPQIYFGFKNKTQPYADTLKAWGDMVTAPGVKLYVGLAAYKVGITDPWAGDGKDEWAANTDLLARMTQEARSYKNYGGVVLFRYDSLFYPANAVSGRVQREAQNLKKILATGY